MSVSVVMSSVISFSTENGIPYLDQPTAPTLVIKGICTMPISIGGSSGSGEANSATTQQEVQTAPAKAYISDRPGRLRVDKREPSTPEEGEAPTTGDVQPKDGTALTAELFPTRHPMLDFCETCQRAKANKKQRRKRENRKACEENGKLPQPAKFGEVVTMDHLVLRSDMSDHVDVVPSATRTEGSVSKGVMEFQGPDPTQRVVKKQTDGAPELTNALADLRIYNDTSTPFAPQTNSYAERPVGTILGSTRSVLEHAGLKENWWPYAVRRWCLMRNTAFSNGGTPWNKRLRDTSVGDGSHLDRLSTS